MSLVVTGTDTGVGKTIVSALILLRYRDRAPGYWKPVATGAGRESDSGEIRRLTGAEVVPEAYRFRPPVSPHLAARRARIPIDPRAILLQWKAERFDEQSLVIEGIGGVLVPFTQRGYVFADLARALRLPAVVVARSTLGTINHTLLTLEALRRRQVPLAGVVLNGPRDLENRRAIERFGKIRVLAEVRVIPRVTGPALRRMAGGFDRAGFLAKWL